VKRAIWDNLVEAIHASGKRSALAITGGGSGAVGRLLEVPGGSRSVLEATVPYATTALEEYLGGTPDQFCSEATARAMAMAAWVRARRLAEDSDPHVLVGIGTTASLVSAKPKRGEHRIHIGVQTATTTKTEERLAAKLLILALGETCGANAVDAYDRLHEKLQGQEIISRHTQIAEPEWTQLLLGETKCVVCVKEAVPKIVFPGAFNPLHRGHLKMAQIAVEKLGGEVAFELSVTNVDKPPLDFVEICERLRAIREKHPTSSVLLTAAPTFREKAAIVPATTFVVGADTVLRIANPKYYGCDERRRDQAIAEIARAGCRFLVFGRQIGEQFRCLSDVELPKELKALCDEVPESEYHEDVSSTELRRDV
jgi:hypothetical protein